MSDYPSICVVTQPLSVAGTAPIKSFLNVLTEITSVSLITANIPSDSDIPKKYDVVEINDTGTGSGIGVSGIRFLQNQFLMCRAIQRTDKDVVLFFGGSSYVLPLLYSRISNKQVVLLLRGNVPESLRTEWTENYPSYIANPFAYSVEALEEIGFRMAHGIITLSPTMATDLEVERFRNKLYPEGAWHIDIERFQYRNSYEDRDLLVGYMGRLGEEKGVRTLVDVIPHLPDNIQFVFIGDGDLRPYIENRLADEISSGRVEVTGWVDHNNVPKQLNRLKLLVMPSKTEGLPVTILEAFACGTPVYASPVGGVPDVVQTGETGFLMNNQQPYQIAKEIEHIIARNDLEEICKNARHLVEQEYRFEAAVERYKHILKNI